MGIVKSPNVWTRRLSIALAVTLITIMFLSVTASAAENVSVNGLSGLFGRVISSIGNGINKVGTFISNAVNALLEGLKRLFIPSSDFFERSFKDINSIMAKKFGAFKGSIDYLTDRFKKLKDYNDTSGLFTLEFPKNHILSGLSGNILSGFSSFVKLLRNIFTGTIMLTTVFFVYKRIRILLKT